MIRENSNQNFIFIIYQIPIISVLLMRQLRRQQNSQQGFNNIMRSVSLAVFICLFLWLLYFVFHNGVDPRLQSTMPASIQYVYIYMKKPALPLSLNYLQLLSISKNDGSRQSLKNNIKKDPLLVVGIAQNSAKQASINLLDQIQKHQEMMKPYGNKVQSIFLVNPLKSLVFHHENYLAVYAAQLAAIVRYLTDMDQHGKITIVAYQQGAGLLLKMLSEIKHCYLSKIRQILIINPSNPSILLAGKQAHNFLRELSVKVARDKERFDLFKQVRFLIFDTLQNPSTRYQFSKSQFDFFISNSQCKKLSNSLFIWSRTINNVYSILRRNQYLAYEPFVKILALYLTESHIYEMSLDDINDFFLYGEVQWTSKDKINPNDHQYKFNHVADDDSHLEKCTLMKKQEFYQLIRTGSVVINRYCMKFNSELDLKKSLLIYSSSRFLLYGTQKQYIHPYDNATQIIYYLIEKFQKNKTIYIVNNLQKQITIKFVDIYSPNTKPFPINIFEPHSLISICNIGTLFKDRKYLSNQNKTNLTNSRTLLLYPLHFNYGFLRTIFFNLQNGSYESNCYYDITSFSFLEDKIKQKNHIFASMIIFCLICCYLTSQRIKDRFYRQALVNTVLWSSIEFPQLGLLISLNLFVIVASQIIDFCLAMFSFCFDFAILKKYYTIKLVWIPLFIEAFRMFLHFNQPSFWQIFLFIIPFTASRKCLIILFIKIYYMRASMIGSGPDLKEVFIITCWLFINIQSDEQITTRKQLPLLNILKQPIKRVKKQVYERRFYVIQSSQCNGTLEKINIFMQRLLVWTMDDFYRTLRERNQNQMQKILDICLLISYICQFGDHNCCSDIINYYIVACVIIYIYSIIK